MELILETTSKSCMRSLMSCARFSAICLSTLFVVVVVAEFVLLRLACNHGAMSCVETLTLHRRYQLANGKKDSVATFFATPAKIPPGWFTIRARVPVLVPSTTCKYQPVQNQTSSLRQKTTKCFFA